MPKLSQYTLVWSQLSRHYELHTQEQLLQCFGEGEEAAFSGWLDMHSSFAFAGQNGRLSVLKEARSRGNGYWYAYQKQGRQTRKRYLGSSNQVTFARLEQEARILTNHSEQPAVAPEPGTPLYEAQGVLQPGTPPDEARGVLLSSKLTPPRLPQALVERARLLADLATIDAYPLTLVSAAAGSGKTTLLAAWIALQKAQANGRGVQSVDQAVAWLSLEELDDDPIRFWDLVVSAVRSVCPRVGETALALLHSSQPLPLSTILTTFLHDLERVPREVILILDDYHVISDQAICDAIRFFIDHAPASLHLVLVSRTDPDLPLARYRVCGQLLDIRDQELRFTQQETRSFLLHAMGLSLSDDDVTTLFQRTEGWVAGLQLAALSLRKRADAAAFVQDFAGTHRYLLDYVRQDILAPLPPPLQNFLLQTAIVPRMNAALCQAVTEAPDESESQEMLRALEHANLFLVPLDEQRQWYRYHDLFREALLAHLHTCQPQLVPLLHKRAASFYEAQGEWREAITHALAASDHVYAAALMEHAAETLWSRGEAKTLHRWVFSLPDAVLCEHLFLALGAAFRLFDAVNLSSQEIYAGLDEQVAHTFSRLEALLPSNKKIRVRLRSPLPSSDAQLRQRPSVELSEALVTWIEDRLYQLHGLIDIRVILRHNDTSRLLELIGKLETLPEDEATHCDIITLYLSFWLTTIYQECGVALLPRLAEARQHLLAAKEPLMAIRVISWSAQIRQSYAHQLHQARQECREALALIEQIKAQTPWMGYLYACLFTLSYAWNKLDEASHWLQRLQQFARDWQLMQLMVEGETLAAQFALARGDVVAAHEALQRLEALSDQETFADYAARVTELRVKLWLASGNLDEAAAWAANTTFSPESWSPLRRGEFLMLVRVLLAQQQYRQAVEVLARFSQYLDQEGSIDTVLEFRALSVVALHHAGKLEQVAHVATRLFAITEPQGHLRLYLDEGILMQQALSALLADVSLGEDAASEADERSSTPVSISRPYVLRLLTVFEQEAQQSHSSLPRAVQELPGRCAATSLALIEPLTERELEVLRLIATGASNQQIAVALVIQLSTVKKHVGNLLAKLGAESRTQALAQARAFSLL